MIPTTSYFVLRISCHDGFAEYSKNQISSARRALKRLNVVIQKTVQDQTFHKSTRYDYYYYYYAISNGDGGGILLLIYHVIIIVQLCTYT